MQTLFYFRIYRHSMLGSVFCILYRCLDCTWEQLPIHWVMIVVIALSFDFNIEVFAFACLSYIYVYHICMLIQTTGTPCRLGSQNRRGFFLHHVVLGQNRRGASSKMIIIINYHVGLAVLTDLVSPITMSVFKSTSDSTSLGSTSGQKLTKKASQNRRRRLFFY